MYSNSSVFIKRYLSIIVIFSIFVLSSIYIGCSDNEVISSNDNDIKNDDREIMTISMAYEPYQVGIIHNNIMRVADTSAARYFSEHASSINFNNESEVWTFIDDMNDNSMDICFQWYYNNYGISEFSQVPDCSEAYEETDKITKFKAYADTLYYDYDVITYGGYQKLYNIASVFESSYSSEQNRVSDLATLYYSIMNDNVLQDDSVTVAIASVCYRSAWFWVYEGMDDLQSEIDSYFAANVMTNEGKNGLHPSKEVLANAAGGILLSDAFSAIVGAGSGALWGFAGGPLGSGIGAVYFGCQGAFVGSGGAAMVWAICESIW